MLDYSAASALVNTIQLNGLIAFIRLSILNPFLIKSKKKVNKKFFFCIRLFGSCVLKYGITALVFVKKPFNKWNNMNKKMFFNSEKR